MYKLELPEGHLLGAVMRWFSLPHGSLDINPDAVRRVALAELNAMHIAWRGDGSIANEYEPLTATVCGLQTHLLPVTFLRSSGLVLSVEYIDESALYEILGLEAPGDHQDIDFFIKVDRLYDKSVRVIPGILSYLVEDRSTDNLISSGHPEAAYAFSHLRKNV